MLSLGREGAKYMDQFGDSEVQRTGPWPDLKEIKAPYELGILVRYFGFGRSFKARHRTGIVLDRLRHQRLRLIRILCDRARQLALKLYRN